MVKYTKEEIKLFKRLNSPSKIQDYLDKIAYDSDEGTSSPRESIKKGKANCFEGAMIAAAAFEFHRLKPLIVDMVAHDDDDHVIAVYKKYGRWGAVAKSNTTVLRYREPVYKTIRELVMSYFDLYINLKGKKSLRKHSGAFDLSGYKDWQIAKNDLEYLGEELAKAKHFDISPKKAVRNYRKADKLLLQATLIGSDPKGLFKPKR